MEFLDVQYVSDSAHPKHFLDIYGASANSATRDTGTFAGFQVVINTRCKTSNQSHAQLSCLYMEAVGRGETESTEPY